MDDGQLQTVEQVRQFLERSKVVEFRGQTAREILLDRRGADKV